MLMIRSDNVKLMVLIKMHFSIDGQSVILYKSKTVNNYLGLLHKET